MTAARRGRLLLFGIAAAAGSAAAGIAAWRWWRWRRRDEGPGEAPIRATSQASRTAELARLGARTGVAEAAHRARRAVASPAERQRLDDAHALRTAEQVAATLGNLRGALMKLGQMASYLDEGLPEHLRAALAQLQQSAPPMSASLAASVVESELGGRPEEVFAAWEPEPFAAASIGQVHRAALPDGRAVAVKVQYPGLDPEPIVAELKSRLLEELDYRKEADNQRLFGSWYEGHPFIRVPGVVGEASTQRVLTTELVEGTRFDAAVGWSQEERNLAAEAIYRFVFRSIYRLQAFNGDPHPGNYLFQRGGKVTFLDFGLVKHFTPEETEVFGAMIRAIVFDRDAAAFRRAVERAGLLPAGLPFTDEDVAEYFSAFYELVREPEPVAVDSEYASELVRRTFDASSPYGPIMKAANVPPPFVIIQRINLGLFAVLAQLGAVANWRRIAEELWPWVAGPPSTPMGEQEAEWLASRGPVSTAG